ncbi:MAG: hypothetical protein V4739_04225 [Pseudomonadota bacterium]
MRDLPNPLNTLDVPSLRSVWRAQGYPAIPDVPSRHPLPGEAPPISPEMPEPEVNDPLPPDFQPPIEEPPSRPRPMAGPWLN